MVEIKAQINMGVHVESSWIINEWFFINIGVAGNTNIESLCLIALKRLSWAALNAGLSGKSTLAFWCIDTLNMQNSDQSTFSWLGLSNRLSGQWSLDNPRVFHHIPDFCPVDGGQISGFQVVSPHHHRIPTTDLLLQPLCLMDYATEFQDTDNPCTILMAGNLAKEMLWNVNVDYWILSYWWWYYLTLNMIILLYSFVAWLLLAADQPMHQYCLGLAECRHGLDSLILYYRTWHVTVKLFVLHTIQSMPSVA